MDNPNPIAVSTDEIKKRHLAQTKRASKKNLWFSDLLVFSTDRFYKKQNRSSPQNKNHIFNDNSIKSPIIKDDFDSDEIFDFIRNLTDPEHPLTLEQLSVVSPTSIKVDNVKNHIRVCFTPTIPHCSQATLIGLMIRAKLYRCLPPRFKVDIYITQGTHNTEDAINKQLNDKERIAAALENPAILQIINRGVAEEDLDDLARWAIL